MPARKSAKPSRQVRVNQEMLADEAEARIELGLHRIYRASRAGRDPLALYTPRDLARELGVPEARLMENLELVVTGHPELHVYVRQLEGGLYRLDFNVGHGMGLGDEDSLPGQPGFPQTNTGQIDELDALLNPPPHDPWANPSLSFNDGEQVGGLEPEPERPTGWQHIAKDDED